MQTEVGAFLRRVPAAEEDGGRIGDVCGKGVEAAALTGLTRHTLRATALKESSPARVLSDLNEVLLREDGDRYCTAALGRVELHDRGANVTMACGGHPLPLVLRAGGRVERLGVPGSLIGVFEDVAIDDRDTELGPGDALILYTDGVLDPRRSAAIDEEDLEALLETCTGFDALQIADLLGDAVAGTRGEAPDDTALLVVRAVPDPGFVRSDSGNPPWKGPLDERSPSRTEPTRPRKALDVLRRRTTEPAPEPHPEPRRNRTPNRTGTRTAAAHAASSHRSPARRRRAGRSAGCGAAIRAPVAAMFLLAIGVWCVGLGERMQGMPRGWVQLEGRPRQVER
jgi:hypothetical protein